jgi:hypothetical protein
MTEEEPRGVDLSIPPPPERADLRTRVFRRLGEEAGRAASAGRAAAAEVGERAARMGRAASEEVGSRAQRAWMPDDPAVILGSAAFAPFRPADLPPRCSASRGRRTRWWRSRRSASTSGSGRS